MVETVYIFGHLPDRRELFLDIYTVCHVKEERNSVGLEGKSVGLDSASPRMSRFATYHGVWRYFIVCMKYNGVTPT